MRILFLCRDILLASVVFVAAAWIPAHAEDRPFITLASTTSLPQSGLLGYLLPAFTRRTGIEVYVVAIGTGQALKSGELGECDVLLVHDKPRELLFMQNGFGSLRREVMYDDFVLVGPEDDPAKIKGTHDAPAALRRIAAVEAPFISRGDRSGTDAAEQRMWAEAGGRPLPDRNAWYVETGSSMEQTLTTAGETNGYALTDRSTWVKFEDPRRLVMLVDRDPRLRNQYTVMLVNPARHPQVKAALGTRFIDWLTSEEGQSMIAGYRVKGQQLFFPDYVE
jgi:tungstate transport system substrate-binding protein